MIVDLDRFVRRLEPNGEWSNPAPLSTYRYAPAYVLLGDPGAGKSTAFEREQSATPRAEPVTARDFRTIYGDALSPQTETLFIDGLDEARAGGGDPRSPFDEIRTRLRQLTPKRVRISCRELDWLGENDRMNLSKVVPNREVIVLRLEPLNADEQRRIVEARSEIPDAEAFLAGAAERGVGALLANPQTLVLLVQAVGDNGEFPKGRTETFERACMVLAREPNQDHGNANPLPPADKLLDAAGRMCAVSLLSGSAGLALPTAPEADGFVSISALGDTASNAVHAARTRLFVSAGNRRFAPAHANLAAFLAARYLAALMDGSVPSGRILALLAGSDGIPPTHLRSLVAWLAANSPALRRTLIEQDPVAVLMYGDVRLFPPDHKSLLLDEIGAEPTRLSGFFWPRSALEALATSDMEEPLRTLLRDPDRSDRRQTTLAVATEALREARPMAGLATDLLAAVKDPGRSLRVRAAALDAWLRAVEMEPDQEQRLHKVLGDIQTGAVSDPDDELRGALLDAMYPRFLSPSRIWDFYRRERPSLFGRNAGFWVSLPEKAPAEHLPEHLDRLVEVVPDLQSKAWDSLLAQVSLRMLVPGLEHHGMDCPPARLLRWLGIGESRMQWQFPAERDVAERIRAWLEARPETVKALAVAAHDGVQGHPYPFHEIQRILFGARLPEGMGQAVPGVAPEDHPERETERILKGRAYWQEMREEEMREFREERARHDAERIAVVRNHEGELLANRAPPALLHHLALVYLRRDPFMVSGPDSRNLEEVLGGDRKLIQAALTGIRGAPERADLPSADEVLSLKQRAQRPWITAAVLAGLDIRSSKAERIRLTDSQWQTALACRHVFSGPSQDAAWYAGLVQDRPDLVTEVLILFGRALLRAGETSFPDFWNLPRDRTFAAVTKRVTGPLLRAFPVRAKAAQLGLLRELLWSGLIHLESEVFREIIETKLGASSMTKGQRTHWLAAGFALEPTAFLSRLAKAVDGPESRVKPLAEFFAPVSGLGSSNRIPVLTHRLTPSAMGFLIETLGAVFPPIHESGRVTIRGETVYTIQSLIDQLTASPEPEASEALARLRSDRALAKWLPQIEPACNTQRVVRRDTSYQAPSPAQVIPTLRDGPPGSARDLRALVMDRLDRVSKRMRTTPENLWRQYWNEDSYQRPTDPKPEGSGRDSLLVTLQSELPEGCEVRKEVSTAGDGQSDLTVTCGDLHLPLEIKKAEHRDLWRAAGEQLLARYATDPATGGLGVYVVLWFGPELVRTSPTGRRPADPGELRRWLEETLEPTDRPRVAAVVLDVTPPPHLREKIQTGNPPAAP